MAAHHRDDIAGLRGIAIAAVLLFHAGLGAPGGFVGVDVFFVISGLVITSAILRDVENGTFSFAGFIERRVRRLAPALIVVLGACFAATYLLFHVLAFRDFMASLVATLGLSANWYFLSESLGYFTRSAETKPLLHMWSLGIEEQFYLVFPALLIALLSLKRAVPGLAFLLLCSLGYAIFLHNTGNANAAFFGTFSRIWELLAGALIALIARPSFRPVWHELAEAIGLVLIVIPLLLENAARYPLLASGLAVAGTSLLAWSGGQGRVVSRLLASWPLAALGLISYSLYLWHWPILAFIQMIAPGSDAKVLGLLLALALATGSYVFIETPFRTKAIASTRPRLYAALASAFVAFGAMLASVTLLPDAKAKANVAAWSLLYAEQRTTALLAMAEADEAYQSALNLNFRGRDGAYDHAKHAHWTCSYDLNNTSERLVDCLRQQLGAGGALVMGDSIGRDTLHALRRAFPKTNFSMLHQSSCPPASLVEKKPGFCFTEAEAIIRGLKDHITAVILAYQYRPEHFSAIAPTLKFAKEAVGDVVVMGPTPMFLEELPRLLRDLDETPAAISKSDKSLIGWDMDRMAAEVRKLAEDNGAEFIDSHGFYCGTASCRLWIDGDRAKPIYFDDQHLTDAGISDLAAHLASLPPLSKRFGREIRAGSN